MSDYVNDKVKELFSSTWAPGGEKRAEAIVRRIIEDAARAAERSYRNADANINAAGGVGYDPVSYHAQVARRRAADDVRALAAAQPSGIPGQLEPAKNGGVR